ncbi:MAG: SDR family oxidoreductase [Caldilinea sp. CFX5]|nr:SDR family oxidoreductase [Caldilinea sp. CFX5]
MTTIFQRLFSLAGKVALITGAGGGIGRVLAGALAEAGADVALHDLTPEPLLAVKTTVETTGRRALPVTADLRDVTACRQLISNVQSELGRLDILINCAATNRRKPIAAVTEDDFEAILSVNVKSIYFLCQAVQSVMTAQGGGKIINIGSINSLYGLDTVSVYGLTKGALSQMTRVMAVEWAGHNIQVNCIAPGFMWTPLSQPVWADEKRATWLRSRIPTRRPGQPEELVGAVLLLSSAASSYITGQTLVVDGGFLAGGSWEKD